MSAFYLKLRANIELDGDLALAVMEANALFENVLLISKENVAEAQKYLYLSKELFTAHAREKDVIGFIAFKPHVTVFDLLKQLSFIQEIWVNKQDCEAEILETDSTSIVDDFICAIPFLAMSEFLTYANNDAPNLQFIRTILDVLTLQTKIPTINKLIVRANTSTPHVHGLHTYKAKFFPRFIRSLIVSQTSFENHKQQVVLDPFVGSGTAAVEAGLLGFQAVGIDIDKLSCHIAESKTDLLETNFDSIQESALRIYNGGANGNGGYSLPYWMGKKFERSGNLEEKAQYEKQISHWISRLRNLLVNKSLFQTAISDALTRKFNVRMMGTGVGRFALEIQKTNLDKLIDQNIKHTLKCSKIVKLLQKVYRIKFQSPTFINGSATAVSLSDESVDFIITSPPYLPASSGREDYLIGKSISLTALDLMSEAEIQNAETKSIGSMKNQSGNRNGLPQMVYELYDWLFKDELRNIKAQPTLAYYQDLKKSLLECHRVLKKNGKAVFIIGKETVFYSYKTREILYKVACDEIFKQIASSAGFEIMETIDVELDKKNRNARPRSLDKYFETAIILKKA